MVLSDKELVNKLFSKKTSELKRLTKKGTNREKTAATFLLEKQKIGERIPKKMKKPWLFGR